MKPPAAGAASWLGVALLLAAGVAGCSTDGTADGTTRAAPAADVVPAMTVDCDPHTGGTPLHGDESGDVLPPVQQAGRWAGDRYPGATPTVRYASASRTYVSLDDDATGRVAMLHYEHAKGGWYLTELAYC